MRPVLDSSATLAWIYGDETTAAIRGLFDTVAAEGAFAPALWHLEIANTLTVAVRRGRVDRAFRDAALRDAALRDLALLDIAVDPHTNAQAWTAAVRLADCFRLTTYDAAYWSWRGVSRCPSPRLIRISKLRRALDVALLGVEC